MNYLRFMRLVLLLFFLLPLSFIQAREFVIKSESSDTIFGRSYISFQATELLSDWLTVSYEHFFKSGKVSLKCPLSVGLTECGMGNMDPRNYVDAGYYNKDKIFSTGLDINYFLTKQIKTRYYLGPSIEYGLHNYSISINENRPLVDSPRKVHATFWACFLQNGFLIRPTSRFSASVIIGIGYSWIHYHEHGEKIPQKENFTIKGGIAIGIRF